MDHLVRIRHPNMEYYRHVYAFSTIWDGKTPLSGKHVIVYMEQGLGDQIQCLRCIPILKATGCKITLHCPTAIHSLIPYVCYEIDFLDKDNPELPPHDYHILSLSMPFLFGSVAPPYVKIDKKADLGEIKGYNIGIAWEGSPTKVDTLKRACPLRCFRPLHDKECVNLFMLQRFIHNVDLLVGAEDMNLLGYPIKDFVDTAELINAMDLVVTVDTSILHLAGAMNKVVYALLAEECDPRWGDGNKTIWYPSVRLFRKNGSWEDLIKEIALL